MQQKSVTDMPRQTTIARTVGDDPKREFTITFVDDDPPRAEAVAFFQNTERRLFPAMNLPEIIDGLSLADAQYYLDTHPMQQQWSILTIGHDDNVMDDDLARLEHIREIDVLKIHSSRITDAGLRHLKWLNRLEWLLVSSNSITDACLEYVSQLTSLVGVDFQLCPNVSYDGYMNAMDRLPNLRDERYPPFRNNAK